MDTTVKTFAKDNIKRLLEKCDPKLKQYIKAHENQINGYRDLDSKRHAKFLDLSKENVELQSQIDQLEADRLEMAEGYIDLCDTDYNHDVFSKAEQIIKESK